jgi:hypothetical protein
MELFSHERTEGVSYGRISYCYGRPGLIDDNVPLTDDHVRIPELPASWEPAARFGARRFVFRACEDLATSRTSARLETGSLWQGGRILVWTPAKAGDKLRLSFTITEEGDYGLMLACMLRPDGGAFRAKVDGDDVPFNGKESVSLVAPHQVQSRVVGVQLKELRAGKHELTLTALNAGKPIGLDFLGLGKN